MAWCVNGVTSESTRLPSKNTQYMDMKPRDARFIDTGVERVFHLTTCGRALSVCQSNVVGSITVG